MLHLSFACWTRELRMTACIWNESVAEFYKEEKARESTANTDTMSRWSSENNVAEEQANTQIRLGRLKGMP